MIYNKKIVLTASVEFCSNFLPFLPRNISVVITFATHIPQTPVLVHETGQFFRIHKQIGQINKLNHVKTDAVRTKKSNLFERSTISDNFVYVLTCLSLLV